jgi:ornithine cyclodeaminase/alanine dehydrogenase-like protein (mu-crystallin family)
VQEFESILCNSRDEARREKFAAKMTELVGAQVTAVKSAQEAVGNADVVIAMTNAAQPVIQGEWLKPGAHVNATGSNWATRREVDTATVRRCHSVFADSVAGAKIEAGDLILAVQENALGWNQVQELSALVSGRAVGRSTDSDITLFKSCGIALEDVAVGSFVYERAKELGIGRALEM